MSRSEEVSGVIERKLLLASWAYIALIVVVALVAAGLTFALSPGPSVLRLLLAVLACELVVLAFIGWGHLVRRRRVRGAATASATVVLAERAELSPPVAAGVDELEAQGLRWIRARRTPKGVTAGLLSDDGIVVGLAEHRGRVVVQARSCLVPEERWLITTPTTDSWVGHRFLIDVHRPIAATPTEVLAHHRATRAALHDRGVAIVAVTAEGAVADGEAVQRAFPDDIEASEPPYRPGRVRPLLDRPDLEPELAAIRRRQVALGLADPG